MAPTLRRSVGDVVAVRLGVSRQITGSTLAGWSTTQIAIVLDHQFLMRQSILVVFVFAIVAGNKAILNRREQSSPKPNVIVCTLTPVNGTGQLWAGVAFIGRNSNYMNSNDSLYLRIRAQLPSLTFPEVTISSPCFHKTLIQQQTQSDGSTLFYGQIEVAFGNTTSYATCLQLDVTAGDLVMYMAPKNKSWGVSSGFVYDENFYHALFRGLLEGPRPSFGASISALLPSTNTSLFGFVAVMYNSSGISLGVALIGADIPCNVFVIDHLTNVVITPITTLSLGRGSLYLPLQFLSPGEGVTAESALVLQRLSVHISFDEYSSFRAVLNPEPWISNMNVQNAATEELVAVDRRLACTRFPAPTAWIDNDMKCFINGLKNLFCRLENFSWCIYQKKNTSVSFPRDTNHLQVGIVVTSFSALRREMVHVHIPVIDINNHPPVFVETTLHLAIFENMPAGTLAGSVLVMDDDVTFGPPEVHLIHGDLETDESIPFSVKNISTLQKGLYSIDIVSTTVLDRETVAAYSFVIIASDGIHSTRATVNITVLDTNDHRPILIAVSNASCSQTAENVTSNSQLQQESEGTKYDSIRDAHIRNSGVGSACQIWSIDEPPIPEDSAIGSIIAVLVGVDDDDSSSGAGQIFASLISDTQLGCPPHSRNMFSLSPVSQKPAESTTSWNLILTSPLDFEQAPVVRICIRLKDAGLPPLAFVVVINIHVQNVPFKAMLSSKRFWHWSISSSRVIGDFFSDYSGLRQEEHRYHPAEPLDHTLNTLRSNASYLASPFQGIKGLNLWHNGETDVDQSHSEISGDWGDSAHSATYKQPTITLAFRINNQEEQDCIMSEWIALPVCYHAASGLRIDPNTWRDVRAKPSHRRTLKPILGNTTVINQTNTNGSANESIFLEDVLMNTADEDVVRPLVRFVIKPRDVHGFGRDCPRYDTITQETSRVELSSALRSPHGSITTPGNKTLGALYTLHFVSCRDEPDNIPSSARPLEHVLKISDVAKDKLALHGVVSDLGARNGFLRNHKDHDGWFVNGARIKGSLDEIVSSQLPSSPQVVLQQTRVSFQTASLEEVLNSHGKDSRGQSPVIDLQDGSWHTCKNVSSQHPFYLQAKTSSGTTVPCSISQETLGPGLHTIEIAAAINNNIVTWASLPLLLGNTDVSVDPELICGIEKPAADPCTGNSQRSYESSKSLYSFMNSSGIDYQMMARKVRKVSPPPCMLLEREWEVLQQAPVVHLSDAQQLIRKSRDTLKQRNAQPMLRELPKFANVAPATVTNPFIFGSYLCKGDNTIPRFCCSLLARQAQACKHDLTDNSRFPPSNSGSPFMNDEAFHLSAVLLGLAQGFTDVLVLPKENVTLSGRSNLNANVPDVTVQSDEQQHIVQIASTLTVRWLCPLLPEEKTYYQCPDIAQMLLGSTHPRALTYVIINHQHNLPFLLTWPIKHTTLDSKVKFVAACTHQTRFLVCWVNDMLFSPCGTYEPVDEVFYVELPLQNGRNSIRFTCVNVVGQISQVAGGFTQIVDREPLIFRIAALPQGCRSVTHCVTSVNTNVAALVPNKRSELQCREGHFNVKALANMCCERVASFAKKYLSSANSKPTMSSNELMDGAVLWSKMLADSVGEGNVTHGRLCFNSCMSGQLFTSYGLHVLYNYTVQDDDDWRSDAFHGTAYSSSRQHNADICFASLSDAVRAHREYSMCIDSEIPQLLKHSFAHDASLTHHDTVTWTAWTSCDGSNKQRHIDEPSEDHASKYDELHHMLTIHQVRGKDEAGNGIRMQEVENSVSEGGPFAAWLVDQQYRSPQLLDSMLDAAMAREKALIDVIRNRCQKTSHALVATTIIAGMLCLGCGSYLMYIFVTWEKYVDRLSRSGEGEFEQQTPHAKLALQQALELIHMSDLGIDGSFEINPGLVEGTEDDLIANSNFLYELGRGNAYADDNEFLGIEQSNVDSMSIGEASWLENMAPHIFEPVYIHSNTISPLSSVSSSDDENDMV